MSDTSGDALRRYLSEIEGAHRMGNATEHTYRPMLKTLLEGLAHGVTATNEPKRVACGAPDYVVTTGQGIGQRTIGHVEAKDIGVPLDVVEQSDQLKRYRRALHNLLLTNYLEFRWYRHGQPRADVRLASLRNGRVAPDTAALGGAGELLRAYLTQTPELIRSPKDLAERMARLTHMLRDIVVGAFEHGAASDDLKGLRDAFTRVLIPDLSASNFGDMFAQTLAYGLFAARVRHSGAERFTRGHAAAEIPRTNPLLRRLFGIITGPQLNDEPYVGFVDELAELLADADLDAILKDFGRRTRQEDAIVHFYETFLTAYDPKLRELRGVYYTPEPVVSYIVRSVDALLRRDFGCAEGLADRATIVHQRQAEDGAASAVRMPRVLLLDPACGTGTFLYAVVDHIRERFMRAGNAGMWSGYVRDHLLPRLFGFELLMAPYAMAHLKLGLQLGGMDLPEAARRDWAYDFASEERLGIFLTNTLDEAAKQVERLPMATWISDEANQAASIKRDDPVMVVLGNPPYSGHSANKGQWINGLLRGEDVLPTQGNTLVERGKGRPTDNYFMVDGQPLGERNPKWLNDDYVKFIRFAQWRIARTGHGVLAFITNHGYLDNPTFRGMRQSLLTSFDDIYVLNLHGNAKKKERAPGGGKDENVFDIQQGVAIALFVRRQREPGAARRATVRYADLWGTREAKYAWLAEQDVVNTSWQEVAPQKPMYFFTPRDTDLEAEYNQGKRVTDVMAVNSLGIVTARDELTIHWTVDDVWQTITTFAKMGVEEARSKYDLGPDARDWQVALAQKDINDKGLERDKIKPILYRPFDQRQTYYTGTTRGFQCMPRPEVMRHMLAGANLGLTTNRQVNSAFYHVLCARDIIDNCVVSNETRERSYLFPLYLYPDMSKAGLWDATEPLPNTPGHRRANLAPEFIADCAARLGLRWVEDGKGDGRATFGPEDVFAYIYAVLHAPGYRERYAEFLKSDFPRVPVTSDAELFWALVAAGERLVGLHLMERRAPALTRYPVRGSNRVERVWYADAPTVDESDGEPDRVWINESQYFAGVPRAVWEFHIGGYQVCEKWLKDRKGRVLSFDDLEHYQSMVAALAETRLLMEGIDEVIEEHGSWPLN